MKPTPQGGDRTHCPTNPVRAVLAVIEVGFGTFGAFNRMVRDVMRRCVLGKGGGARLTEISEYGQHRAPRVLQGVLHDLSAHREPDSGKWGFSHRSRNCSVGRARGSVATPKARASSKPSVVQLLPETRVSAPL